MVPNAFLRSGNSLEMRAVPRIDIFCGQEHHLRIGRLHLLSFQIWKDADFYYCPASDGMLASRDPEADSGKGGLFIAVGPRMIPSLSAVGFLPSGHGMWCIFKHPKLGDFGIINVYAPTGLDGERDRTRLWGEVFAVLRNDLVWLLMGDFNMVENLEDQVGGRPHVIAGRELRARTHLKRKMKWQDTFKHFPGQLRFSWCNNRSAGSGPVMDRIYRCLDRCYAPVDSSLLQFLVVSTIIPAQYMSDHHPISISCLSGTLHSFPSKFTMNVTHFLDSSFQQMVELLRAESCKLVRKKIPPDKVLESCLKRATNLDRAWGKKQALIRG